MTTIMSNPFSSVDSLSTIDFELMNPPLRSALSPNSYTIPTVFSTPTLHTHRPVKRVRFALSLDPVVEDSLPSNPQVSPPMRPKRIKRTIEPGPPSTPLQGGYTEHWHKQDALKHHEAHMSQTPSPETSSEPATYTHTFVIQSKSPAIIIDSITVSTPQVHLPQIIHRQKKPVGPQPAALELHVKQQPTLSISPRAVQSKKLADATNQRHHYISVRSVPQRAESTTHASNGSQLSHRTTPTNDLVRSKTVKDHPPSKKIAETTTNKTPPNQASHAPDRSTPSRNPRKIRQPSRLRRTSDELKLNKHSLFRKRHGDHHLPPAIHSTH